MGRRFQARRLNGRFTRNTLANTFGFRAEVCAACRGFTTYSLNEPKPEKCGHCGGAKFLDGEHDTTRKDTT